MDINKLTNIISELEDSIPAKKIAILLYCENFETVYVEMRENNAIFLTDNYETFRYLASNNNSTYINMAEINFEIVKNICNRNHVSIVEPPDDETYHEIVVEISNSESVRDAVLNMCNAIDEIFDYAIVDDQ